MKILISILSFFSFVLAGAGSDSFYLTGENGEQLGPFDFKEQSSLKIGKKNFTLSKVLTEKQKIEEILASTIVPELDLATEGLEKTVDLMNKALSSGGGDIKDQVQIAVMESARSKTCRKDLAKQKNISVKEALMLITKESGTKWLIHGSRIHISSINDPDGPLMTRFLTIRSTSDLNVSPVSESGEGGDVSCRNFFAGLGVQWPEGSSVKYSTALGQLCVKNTEENLAMIEELLKLHYGQPCQIEVEVQFVEYDRADISAISTGGVVNLESLVALRSQGKGKLLYAPKVVAKPGTEATVKGVSEYIYPTDFTGETVASSSATNGTGSYTNRIVTEYLAGGVPGNFETREVGAVLSVTPVMSEGDVIDLTVVPEIVYEPVWKDYAFTYADMTGKEHKGHAEQPIFHSQRCLTSISVKNGETILIGGGMPGRDNAKMVYTFLTARMIDIKGKAVKNRPVFTVTDP